MMKHCIADAGKGVGMKSLSPKEAAEILKDMKVEIKIPKAAVTQQKRNIALDMAIEALNRPEIPDSWIPVSERLPQSDPEDLEYPTVIICSPNGSVELGCFYESTKEWGAGENFDRLRNPVAWMPLPEPWEGE